MSTSTSIKNTGQFTKPLFIEDLNTPLVYGTFGVFITILCVITIAFIFPQSKIKQTILGEDDLKKNIGTGVIVTTIVFAILAIVLLIIPSYKDILGLFVNLKYVFLIIIYCIGILIFFRSVDSEFLSTYAYILSPVTILIGIILFYLSINADPMGIPDINFERIKYTLTFFLLIVFMLIFYTVDPGNYVKQYFGPSLVITILLAVFGLLYLITIMTYPTIKEPTSDSVSNTSFFKGFTWGGVISNVSFIVFLILLIIGIITFPDGFLSDTTGHKELIIMLAIFIFLIWILFTMFSLFSNETVAPGGMSAINSDLTTINGIGRRIFTLLFGLIFSGILIAWLVKTTQYLSKTSDIISFVLNLLIIITILALVFKLITVSSVYKYSPLFRLIVSVILYIPCVLVNIIDGIVTMLGLGLRIGSGSTASTPYTYYILLFIILLLYIIYFSYPYFSASFAKQGGKLIVNQPVSINNENIIGTYQALNGSDQLDYRYAISFWLYIDAENSSIDKYVSIMNYGNKPNILYNAKKNILMVTMKNDGEKAVGSFTTPQTLDEDNNIIILKQPNMLLQKWSNIIVNYNGGTLDIFLNGELIKSVIEIIPKLAYDNLTIGTNDRIEGQICNLNYFDRSLDATQIYYLYNIVKDKTPPVSKDSKDTIINIMDQIPKVLVNKEMVVIPTTTTQVSAKINSTVEKAANVIKGALYDPYAVNDTDPNYLSPKWYFTNNGDIYNG